MPARRSSITLLALSQVAFSIAACDSPPETGASDQASVARRVEFEGATELRDENPDPGIVEVTLTAAAAEAELVPGQRTRVLAFNGSVPGPLLHARVGDRIIVHFKNDLAEPTTIHWHGLRIDSAMDGTPRVQDPIPAGGSFTYDFVVKDAGTYWYHPHATSIEQVDRGLYAPLVIEEAEPPKFDAERIIVLDDVKLDGAYQMAPYGGMTDMMMGRMGNVLLANGQSLPKAGQRVERGRIERWRLINAAGARLMQVTVEGASFRVIATDGGLLPSALTPTTVELAVGQRFDLEVLYDKADAATAGLFALVRQSTGAIRKVPLATYDLVEPEGATRPSARPVYPVIRLPAPADAPLERELRFAMTHDESGMMMMTINGQDGMTLPVENFVQERAVRFTLVNDDEMHGHPFHLHGNFFQILERDGQPANEPGLKDTVQLRPASAVTIETSFENVGDWMYHCHIVEHAENGMMAEIKVHPAPAR